METSRSLKERALSALLALAVLLSLILQTGGGTLTAWAADGDADSIIDDGECGAEGSNLTWTLDDKGTLTIAPGENVGTGEMADFTPSSTWDDNEKDVKAVVIKPGVTSIGDYAFAGCTGLERIEIPDSVTSIGTYAFYYCTRLESITIPGSMTSIGEYAFEGCAALKDITIQHGVTSIGAEAFSSCTGLESIEIPDSVTSIGASAFSGCEKLTDITIPANVTSIGEFAFYSCEKLTEITIPASVTSIEASAFAYCTGLTDIEIPASVTSIGNEAFALCTGLTDIEIPASVKSIGELAFHGCEKLTEITIPANVESIGAGAFYNCSKLAKITFAGGAMPTLENPNPTYPHFGDIDLNATVYYPIEWADTDVQALQAAFPGATLVPVCAPDAHTWDEGKVTTQPTEAAAGVKTYTCTTCGQTKTEELAPLTPAPTPTPAPGSSGGSGSSDGDAALLVGAAVAGGAAALAYYYREALPIWKLQAAVALPDGTPAANAAVTLVRDGATVKTLTANADGVFSARLPKGEYTAIITYTAPEGVQYAVGLPLSAEALWPDAAPTVTLGVAPALPQGVPTQEAA